MFFKGESAGCSQAGVQFGWGFLLEWEELCNLHPKICSFMGRRRLGFLVSVNFCGSFGQIARGRAGSLGALRSRVEGSNNLRGCTSSVLAIYTIHTACSRYVDLYIHALCYECYYTYDTRTSLNLCSG